MAKMGNCNFSEFRNLQNKLNKLSDSTQIDKLMNKCVQEIAMQTLRKVIKLTPVAETIRILVDVLDDTGNKVRYKKR